MECKMVKIPAGNHKRRARERILNRWFARGWRLQEVQSGGFLGPSQIAVLVRDDK